MSRSRDARRVVVGGVLAFLFQLGMADRLNVGPGWPDLAMAFVSMVALASGARYAAVSGLALGFALDLFTGHWLGLRALAYGLTGYGLGRLVTPFDEKSRAVAFFGAGLAAVAGVSVEATMVGLLAGGLEAGALFLGSVPNVVLTASLVAILAPYDLGFPPRAQTDQRELRELKLWF